MGRLPALLPNVKHARKYLPMKNTLAYYSRASARKKQVFQFFLPERGVCPRQSPGRNRTAQNGRDLQGGYNQGTLTEEE
jgi:hypothetical protein